ncbi:MAG: magnesium transporter CorA family protein [Actinobacteria bacterium]|nr:magnesium transporter CorA family protein [Actinomycetota bacterium]MBI3688480.1 magnesium transporter CorA family protein [Actinomycetota bacterium]
MARTRLYRNGVLELENFPVEDISEYLTDPAATVWLDMCAPDEHDLAAISEELDLHQLAVEDAVHKHQRPKLDRYDTHLFLSAYEVTLDRSTHRPLAAEVAVFVTHNALVTVRASADFAIDEVVARWDASTDLAEHGVAFLLHGLLDHVVDSHFTAVSALDEEIEDLQEVLFADGRTDRLIQERSFTLRRGLVLLRRVVLPTREVVNALMRRDLHVLDEAMLPYFQDVYDHVLRVSEWTESLRDLVATVMETNLTIQGNRLNTIMKQVTSWAAIIAVPTAVTGFYGQNVPYPGFGERAGFWASIEITLALSVILYFLFRRRNWL